MFFTSRTMPVTTITCGSVLLPVPALCCLPREAGHRSSAPVTPRITYLPLTTGLCQRHNLNSRERSTPLALSIAVLITYIDDVVP